jgi:hypothetical protein
MTENKTESWEWWGTYQVPDEGVRHHRVGPLHVWIQRLSGEWRVAWERDPDSADAILEMDRPIDVHDFLTLPNATRYVFGETSDSVSLQPALADRPVVTSAEYPLHMAPDEEAIVYVSSPLWVRVEVPTPGSNRVLCELPVTRLPDTWFGPDTLEGELCYAARTVHRIQLDRIPFLPHRTTTAVQVLNRARKLLTLQRMKLPVPNLSLFQTGDHRLWTQDVVFERSREDDSAVVHLPTHGDRVRVHAGKARLIAPARKPVVESAMVRAFSSLFGK